MDWNQAGSKVESLLVYEAINSTYHQRKTYHIKLTGKDESHDKRKVSIY